MPLLAIHGQVPLVNLLYGIIKKTSIDPFSSVSAARMPSFSPLVPELPLLHYRSTNRTVRLQKSTKNANFPSAAQNRAERMSRLTIEGLRSPSPISSRGHILSLFYFDSPNVAQRLQNQATLTRDRAEQLLQSWTPDVSI